MLKLQKEWRVASLDTQSIGAHKSGLIGRSLNIQNNIFPVILVARKNIKCFEIFGNNWETKDGTEERLCSIMDLSEAHLSTGIFI